MKVLLLLVAFEQQKSRPRGRDGRRVLTSKEDGDEHAKHLVIRQLRTVTVLGMHERVQHILLLPIFLTSLFDDAVEDLCEFLACGVAASVRFDGEVREEDGERHHAHVKLVHEVRHLVLERLAYLLPEQTP